MLLDQRTLCRLPWAGPDGEASIDPATGHDVNVVNDWRSSMMANSARDPFFRAKLDHEVLVNPGHADAIATSA